jgi:L-ascorbate metabolism protein UlaG (beta-lactamase superfamily)
MKLQIIRNATMRIEYAGRKFVTDPYLAAKHTRPSYTGKSPNPLVELPIPAKEVIEGAEMALISHLHSDHFDPAAQELLPKELEIICQAGDEERLQGMGFRRVTPVQESLDWHGITIRRVAGQHGSGEVLKDMGEASGFVLQAESEPSVYWVGDTILSDEVKEAIQTWRPEIIITHSCGAVWGQGVLILMDAIQTVAVCQSAPWATVVAVHMEALDHATVTRKELRSYATEEGIDPEQLLIPADGEELIF